MRWFTWIALLATAASVTLAVVARVPTYRFAPVFLVPVIWVLVLLRRPLHLHPAHYALLASAIILHNFGALGWYQRGFLGISFDVYVHFYFAFAATFVLQRLLRRRLSPRPWGLRLLTLLCMMGLGALHEIMEYLSYLLLGEERGMLKPETSYFFDTQRDLTSNLAGCVAALVVIGLVRSGRRER